MHPLKPFAALLVAAATLPAVAEAADLPAYFTHTHAAIVAAWLADHPDIRIATDRDCGCDKELARVRRVSFAAWKANPGYHPYYVAGDFNGDGVEDVAVGIIDAKDPGTFRVAVFNGPLTGAPKPEPVFLSQPRRLGQGMFFGAPRPRPYWLVVGGFDAEGAVFRPTQKGYVLVDAND